MIFDSSGSRRRKAATVSGASVSSRRAASSNPPAVIRSMRERILSRRGAGDVHAATASISTSLSFPAKDGIAPCPFRTRSATSDADGFAESSEGPTVPVAPASASV